MSEILPKNFGKCCLRYDLMIGCAIYVTVEIYLWAILSIASIYSELKMIENRDVGAFKNFTSNYWYYITIFGNPSDDIGRAVICKLMRDISDLVENFMNENLQYIENSISSTYFFAVTQIVVNGILSIALLLYCIFAVILLIGISEVCENIFIHNV